jgi:hypothetical protein
MPSSIAKGNYYRLRTRKWLESLGYTVENAEVTQRIVTKDGLVLFKKRDLWGADLLVRDESNIIFVQVKTNKGDLAKGMRELSKGPWPLFVGRWVCWWPPRRRLEIGPEIVEVKDAENGQGV